ncbi:MAG: allantoinase AllB [Bacteroidota bacterium]
MTPDLVIQSERVVTSRGIRKAAVVIRQGKVADIRAYGKTPGKPLLDFGKLVVMPGLVDTHVHINEPGRAGWEGFETATKAAAAGGITTLVDMPLNSSPVITTVKDFRAKIHASKGKLWVDCGFYGGLIPGNTNELKPLMDAGVLGVKAFLVHSGIDEFPNATEADLHSGMPVIAKAKIPLLVHCELSGANPQLAIRNPKSYHDYLATRPREWEQGAIQLMIRLCKEYKCRTHIVHLSSADAVPTLKKARKQKLPLTVETCPHYLFFSAEEIPDADTRFKCAPPIRESENRDRLWRALKDGVIDFIVSDHSPSPPELKMLKEGDFQKAWGGIASLQLGLSIVWTEARKRGFSVEDIARWMCGKPAELVGLKGRKGSLRIGSDADIVVWDPEASFVVEVQSIFHRHKVTPYLGRTLFGKVFRTFLSGQTVFENGRHVDGPHGSIILRSTLSRKRRIKITTKRK